MVVSIIQVVFIVQKAVINLVQIQYSKWIIFYLQMSLKDVYKSDREEKLAILPDLMQKQQISLEMILEFCRYSCQHHHHTQKTTLQFVERDMLMAIKTHKAAGLQITFFQQGIYQSRDNVDQTKSQSGRTIFFSTVLYLKIALGAQS